MSAVSVRVIDRLQALIANAWNALDAGSNPFISYEFLHALEATECLREDWGWQPQHLTLWEGERLIAAAPGYRKTNSHGEFVFDHGWARAYEQNGLEYYPKWLCASPYSPVTGPRLLARDAPARQRLLQAIVEHTQQQGYSSAHVNFHTPAEESAFDAAWLARIDVQYHWRNLGDWRDFDEFLQAMDHKHRKNIRAERRKLQQIGVSYRVLHGDEASEADIARMYGFYLQTFAEYGNSPALTLEFFMHLAQAMPRQLLLVFADLHGHCVAGALFLRGGDSLYGRYWGSIARVPGLHFELCYYQAIDYCLREGLARIEPGAQGEHKLARGFLPQIVHSRHWLANHAFRAALQRWCAQEAAQVRGYAQTLAAHSPFKPDAVIAPDPPLEPSR